MSKTLPTADRSLTVRHYVSGGEEHGGGIGRLVGYIAGSASLHHHIVTDTRGPRWDPLRSPPRLLAALGAMLGDRIVAPQQVHHIHIAGRGSTARKLILGAAARLLGCTHVLHQHDYDYAADFQRRPAWQRRAIRALFRGAARVVVLGERDRRTAVGLLGVVPDRVSVLHNAVPDPSRPDTPRRSEPERPVGVLFLGQLGPRKGVPELLRALADPRLAGLDWRAVLAGDGPVDSYRDEAARLGLSQRVSLPGWLDRDRIRALCDRSDILVLPSHGEGMAMAVLEGLAHGLAVVATPVGAHEEVLRDGETCAFVPVGDADALAATLARLIACPVERDRLARAGRAHFVATLSLPAYIRRLDALHQSLMRRRQVAATAETGPA